MNPSKKLFLAATLVAAGYGIATLLGAPDPRFWSDGAANLGLASNHPTTIASRSDDEASGPAMVGSVRLLPEPSTASAERSLSTETTVGATQSSPLPEFIPARQEVAAQTVPSEPDLPILSSRTLPRATLKNEAPRPLPIADQPPQPVAIGNVDATSYTPTLPAIQVGSNNQVISAGFTPIQPSAAPASQFTWATNPPLLQPIEAAHSAGQSGPPPWPIPEAEPLRSHVIVDGDSLAKLAGRYLDDPRRSDEIFVLNRSALSDPELLPIGVELKIPPRDSSSSISQSRASGASSLHAAVHTGLVPVRLPPTDSGSPPRALLLPPMPVD